MRHVHARVHVHIRIYMVTKRQLGIIVIVLGLLVVVASVAVDLIGAGKWSGLGPLQQMVIGLSLAGLIVGIILFCLGDRPA